MTQYKQLSLTNLINKDSEELLDVIVCEPTKTTHTKTLTQAVVNCIEGQMELSISRQIQVRSTISSARSNRAVQVSKLTKAKSQSLDNINTFTMSTHYCNCTEQYRQTKYKYYFSAHLIFLMAELTLISIQCLFTSCSLVIHCSF